MVSFVIRAPALTHIISSPLYLTDVDFRVIADTTPSCIKKKIYWKTNKTPSWDKRRNRDEKERSSIAAKLISTRIYKKYIYRNDVAWMIYVSFIFKLNFQKRGFFLHTNLIQPYPPYLFLSYIYFNLYIYIK